MSQKVLTLCLVVKDGQVLLGMKKRGFGKGRWNGFGGKVESGETIEEAAKREVFEEVSLQVQNMEKAGELTFTFADREGQLLVHVFRVDSYEGEPIETEEMRPEWFKLDEMPFANMWSDDEHWFPYFLKGTKFNGAFHFDKPATTEHPAHI
jgi:8-oxo-dGTP diphosphatase/2-hydroxy-dATP diphosphatase